MPNVSRINGFRVVKTQSGNNIGVANLYYVASAADEILVGDIVKHGCTTDANGYPPTCSNTLLLFIASSSLLLIPQHRPLVRLPRTPHPPITHLGYLTE